VVTRFETVLLDLDGTLLDERVNLQGAFDAAARTLYDFGHAEFDLHQASAIARQMASTLWEEPEWLQPLARHYGLWSHDGLSEQFPGPGEDLRRLQDWLPGFRTRVWHQCMDTLGLSPDPTVALAAGDAFVRARHSGRLRPMRGAVELLQWLGDRRRAVCTNGPADGQRRKAERAGLSSLVGPVISSTAAGAGKPDIAVIADALDAVGAPLHSAAVFVGDTVATDAAAALACGIPVIIMWPPVRGGFPDPPHPWVRFCRSLPDVPDLISSLEHELVLPTAVMTAT
jgi:putative hydrolase of the HAD superfamily